MPFVRIFRAHAPVGLALAWVLAGCTNAGFGSPASGPPPVSNGYPPGPFVSPVPSGSGVILQGVVPAPAVSPAVGPVSSPSPTPTPVPNTLSILGAALRLAYDGSAKDPLRAPRVLELTFALQNTTRAAAKVASISAYADKAAVAEHEVSVAAAPNQTSEVAAIALKTGDDPAKYKELTLNFLDDAKRNIASLKLDVPPIDTSFTALDEKHPKGAFSIDSAEISNIDAGQGSHFECMFALTNAGAAQAPVSEFDVTPPKGTSIRVALPMTVPARSVSGFISIVLPYEGKSLPSGAYVITAVQNGATVAKSSATLL